MTKRFCFNCSEPLPPETEHFLLNDEVYCKDCVEVQPYTAYQYFVSGEFMADSEHNDGGFIESYDDLYED